MLKRRARLSPKRRERRLDITGYIEGLLLRGNVDRTPLTVLAFSPLIARSPLGGSRCTPLSAL
jgi:hypothetical protein